MAGALELKKKRITSRRRKERASSAWPASQSAAAAAAPKRWIPTSAERYALAALSERRVPTARPHLAKLAKFGLIARSTDTGRYELTRNAHDTLKASGARSWYGY